MIIIVIYNNMISKRCRSIDSGRSDHHMEYFQYQVVSLMLLVLVFLLNYTLVQKQQRGTLSFVVTLGKPRCGLQRMTRFSKKLGNSLSLDSIDVDIDIES